MTTNALLRKVSTESRLFVHRDAPLWTVVAELTNSTAIAAKATCVALGLNPHITVGALGRPHSQETQQ